MRQKTEEPKNASCIRPTTYVQLSQLRSLDGLHLLQRIEMEDLRFRPDDRLLIEMQRLKALERETIGFRASACGARLTSY